MNMMQNNVTHMVHHTCMVPSAFQGLEIPKGNAGGRALRGKGGATHTQDMLGLP